MVDHFLGSDLSVVISEVVVAAKARSEYTLEMRYQRGVHYR